MDSIENSKTTEEQLKEVYSLYTIGDYIRANELNEAILTKEPGNMYAAKYKSILLKKVSPETGWKKAYIGWIGLKCPHCESKIALSALNEDQQKKISNKDILNLPIKCPYCHTEFILQNQTESSLLWLKVWYIGTIDDKKYRITGYVKYVGKWTEYIGWSLDSTWRLEYLEWILLSEKNEFLYLSESISIYDWEEEIEFELSKKITPTFSLEVQNSIKVNGEILENYENNSVTIKSVYGENSKSYTIGEKVELTAFGVSGLNYVCEEEWAWTQKEIGVYATKIVSKKEILRAFEIKEGSIASNENTKNLGWISINFNSKPIFASILIWLFIGICIYMFAIVGWGKTLVDDHSLIVWKSYYIDGKHTDFLGETTCSDDEGSWTCYQYRTRNGIAFSIKDETDRTGVSNLKENIGNITNVELKDLLQGKVYEFHGDYKMYQQLSTLLWIILWILIFLFFALLIKKK